MSLFLFQPIMTRHRLELFLVSAMSIVTGNSNAPRLDRLQRPEQQSQAPTPSPLVLVLLDKPIGSAIPHEATQLDSMKMGSSSSHRLAVALE
jgi:hypothetical protein